MFRGINSINLDEKGRIAIPARYRAGLSDAGGQLIITIDTEARCLLLYPLMAWQLIEQKVMALPSFNSASRRIQRLLIGHASEVELDSQGRILLPKLLREYAELDKQVTLVGQGGKFEIWSDAHWQRSREAWLSSQSEKEALPDELQMLSL